MYGTWTIKFIKLPVKNHLKTPPWSANSHWLLDSSQMVPRKKIDVFPCFDVREMLKFKYQI